MSPETTTTWKVTMLPDVPVSKTADLEVSLETNGKNLVSNFIAGWKRINANNNNNK